MQIVSVTTSKRGCGLRKEYGLYITSGTGSATGIIPMFTLVIPPVPYASAFHRTPRMVDASVVLRRQPIEEWWVGASQETEDKRATKKISEKAFGMPVSRRLKVGICNRCTTVEEAFNKLCQTMRAPMSGVLETAFRNLALTKLPEYKYTAPLFVQLQEALVKSTKTTDVLPYIEMLAILWQLAYTVPPTMRKETIPSILSMMVSIGAVEDAMEIKKQMTGG